MTKDTHPKYVQTPKKRAGGSLQSDESPSKRQSIISLQLEGSSSSVRNTPSFSMSDPFTTSSSPLRTSPALPLVRDMPLRSSVPLQEMEDVKPFSRQNTVDPGLAVLGQEVTKLVDLITTLRDNGIDRLDIDLPQIVVVGDQSTGKSSLIEGLSAIKVPRKEGTCTRCPIEINLKATSQNWHCRISIVRQYAYRVSDSEADLSLNLGPWNMKYPQAIVEHFIDVNDKNILPVYLSRAQLAVLNPSKVLKTFAISAHQELDSESTQEAFSPNVIRLDIAAPKLPSLSFFDLPGLVVQDVEPYVPRMIRTLVKSYVVSSRSLVLLTLPIDCDRANSQAAGLVFEANAQDRTIGIISKPDKLVSTNIAQWREILAGEKFKLNLGYRVVMNPPDATKEHSAARKEEREFFATNENFAGPLAAFSELFGTEKLQLSLSTQLLDMIRGCLPEIEEKVNHRVTTIERELITLPKIPTGNVTYEITQKFVDLERQLTAAINNTAELTRSSSSPDHDIGVKWFQKWHREAQVFFEQLVRTAPQLDVAQLPSAQGNSRRAEGLPIVIDDDSEHETSRNSTPAKRRPAQAPVAAPANVLSGFSPRQIKDIETAVNRHTKKFTLNHLHGHLHTFNGGVHGIGDPRVFERLFQESIVHWPELLKRFLKFTAQACKHLLTQLLDSLFANLKETELIRRIKSSAEKFINVLEKEQLELSRRLLNVERGKPLTLDAESQEANKRSVLAHLNEQLSQAMTSARINEMKFAELKVTAAEEKKIAEQAKADANNHQHELRELAGTVAYYKVAARRFADYNSLTVRNEFFLMLKERAWKTIASDIGLGPEDDMAQADENLKSLMVPSPRDYTRRRELEQELKILQNTKRDLLQVLDSDAINDMDDLYGSDD